MAEEFGKFSREGGRDDRDRGGYGRNRDDRGGRDRGGNDRPRYGDRDRNDRGSSGGSSGSGGGGYDRPRYGDRDRNDRSGGGGGDRPRYGGGDRGGFDRDRPRFGGGDRGGRDRNESFDRDNEESVFSKIVRAGKRRTYFFDVKKTRGEDYFITITESTKREDGYGYKRHKLFLYKEDFNRFVTTLNEVVDHVKTTLMPDFDYEEFDRRQAEWEAQNRDGDEGVEDDRDAAATKEDSPEKENKKAGDDDDDEPKRKKKSSKEDDDDEVSW
jgi:Protein of unknown function (DUF3276)